MTLTAFEAQLTAEERGLLDSLDTPLRIQTWLDTVVFEPEYFNRNPLRVLRERRGHCYDGALFAATVLRRMGYPPLVVDLVQEPGTDDDHMLAIFMQHGRYGAIGKSNFTGLRYREPVYRGLRELIMSYFEAYFNIARQRTLRAYSAPLRLVTMDRTNWMTDDAGCDAIERRLATLRRYPLVTPQMTADLTLVDARSFAAGTFDSDPGGFFQPPA